MNMCLLLASLLAPFNVYLCCDISAKSDNNNNNNYEDEDESSRGNRRIVIIFAPSFFPLFLFTTTCYLPSLTSIVFRKPLLHVRRPNQPKPCPARTIWPLVVTIFRFSFLIQLCLCSRLSICLARIVVNIYCYRFCPYSSPSFTLILTLSSQTKLIKKLAIQNLYLFVLFNDFRSSAGSACKMSVHHLTATTELVAPR